MRILLALDDSKYSAVVTEALIAQAKPRNCKVHLLHVVEPYPLSLAEKLGSPETPDFVAARLNNRSQAKRILAQAATRLRAAGFTVTVFVEEGDARSIILDHAEAWLTDLIVVGSHGRMGLYRFLMGSVSETVVRHARCSVQIVRTRPVPPPRAR